MALAPLGFGMWLAHFVFHLFTAALTPIPAVTRVAKDLGFGVAEPVWSVSSLAFYNLPGLELLLLDLGFLLTLYIGWRIAGQLNSTRQLLHSCRGVCWTSRSTSRGFGLSFNPWKCAA